uniref:Axin 2 n=1 Tax=Paramormyrops kingsleyae TaxID=1676925 RepID=A0A3B3RU76_9TELE
MSRALTDHISTSFREDAPRPPVPGEEGETPCHNINKFAMMRPQTKAKSVVVASPGPTPRRNEDGLGEPEGSASPDSPLARWTKSLHSLLGDQDGAHLFRTFLEREKCVDTLDFWFACNGFRQMDLKDTKTHRVAKAIYKRYIENNSIVAKQLKPATKTYIKDSIKKQQIDSAMFDQAQTEIQSTMEENAYQMFLTSEIYLEFVRTGCENPAYVNHNGLGSLKLMCGYLPTLNEEEEWSCNDLKAKALASVVGLSAKALRATMSMRTTEVLENGYRSHKHGDPANPYHVNSGYIFAPATSANDSEISSDALTDDSMSMTDSSVLLSSVAPQRTRRLPKEMTPVEPAAFAAELIARLERLKREQETRSSLEERLQQIQEGGSSVTSSVPLRWGAHPLGLLPSGSCEEDPQAILDEHLSRVLKTPGCQSPGMARHSPRSRSPELRNGTVAPKPLPPGPAVGSGGPGCGLAKAFLGRQPTKHVHHHYIHHHAGPKTKEQIEAEAAQRVQGLCPAITDYSAYHKCRGHGKEQGSSPRLGKSGEGAALANGDGGGCGGAPPQLPSDGTDRTQNVWQWILESERQVKHKTHGNQGLKKVYGTDSSKTPPGRPHAWGGGGGNGHLRAHHPAHPFVQDPAMPPLPPPNTLAQLEEACRRLEEVSKPPKQRHSASSLQRDRSHPPPLPSAMKEPKKPAASHNALGTELVVTYFFCGEEIPYRRMMKTHSLTLGHFKEQLRKKGNYRYYFKKASDEFECGAVFEEVWDDGAVLPMYEGKILGKVERME